MMIDPTYKDTLHTSCSCNAPGHTVRLHADEEFVSVTVALTAGPWYRRLGPGLKYILGVGEARYPLYYFEEALWAVEHAEKVVGFLNRFVRNYRGS